MEWWFGLCLRTRSHLGFEIVGTAHELLPLEQVFEDDFRARDFLLSKASAVIALSDATAAELNALGAGYVRVIRMGSYGDPNPVRLTTEEARASFGFDHDDVAAVLLGRIEGYKGADLLLLAAKQLPPTSRIKVLLVGSCSDSRYRKELNRLATEAGKKVAMRLEWVPDDDVARYLQASDMAAFPFREVINSGSVRLAQSFVRPVVIPDLPALGDVPNSTAIRFEPRNDQGVEPLVAALRQAEQLSAAEYRDMSITALTWASRIDWATTAHETIETYRTVCHGPISG
ncbi:MAG TPA: glycosyltransferase family 4 protein [Acidimicrobiales bacterium]|nr:glycosyltransferase family 4 protein [Acidimicrobiales bacterium]